MATVNKNQIAAAERLQELILENFEELLTTRRDQLTATDRATIVRLLQANGWTLDPAQMPTDLKNLLTKSLPEKPSSLELVG